MEEGFPVTPGIIPLNLREKGLNGEAVAPQNPVKAVGIIQKRVNNGFPI
jgi:hypothetical protein